MPLELICRRCGKPYTPTKSDVLSGRYRLCLNCRDEQLPAASGLLITEPVPA